MLREEFIKPLGFSAGKVAKAINVQRSRIERLVAKSVDFTPDTALRLVRFFGATADFWLGIQTRYSLETLEPEIASVLRRIEPISI